MDLPFDRVIVAPRERPSSEDHNRLVGEPDRSLRDMLDRFLSTPAAGAISPGTLLPAAFFGDGYRVVPGAAGLTVAVTAGMGAFYDPSDLVREIGGYRGVHDLSPCKPLALATNETITVPAPPGAGQARIDIVEVQPDRRFVDIRNRDVLDIPTLTFLAAPVGKTLTWDQSGRSTIGGVGSIRYRTGVASVLPILPVPPVADPSYAKIAEIYVANGAAVIDETRIADLRRLALPYNQGVASCKVDLTWTGALSRCEYTEVVAPPGVRVVACGGLTRGRFNLYVIAGASNESPSGVPVLTPGTGAFFSGTGTLWSVAASRGGVNLLAGAAARLATTEATALANAAITQPAIGIYPVGLTAGLPGQPIMVFSGQIYDNAGAAADGTAYVQAEWRYR